VVELIAGLTLTPVAIVVENRGALFQCGLQIGAADTF
jgi:hypothetical protein